MDSDDHPIILKTKKQPCFRDQLNDPNDSVRFEPTNSTNKPTIKQLIINPSLKYSTDIDRYSMLIINHNISMLIDKY